MVHGLWQFLQRIVQPCKNSASRLPGPSTQEKGSRLLTKAHLLFMADHAGLTFQHARIARGFFTQPGGIGARTLRPEFFQI